MASATAATVTSTATVLPIASTATWTGTVSGIASTAIWMVMVAATIGTGPPRAQPAGGRAMRRGRRGVLGAGVRLACLQTMFVSVQAPGSDNLQNGADR